MINSHHVIVNLKDDRINMNQIDSFSSGINNLTKKYFNPEMPIDTSQYPEHLRLFMQREAWKKRIGLLCFVLLAIFVLYRVYVML